MTEINAAPDRRGSITTRGPVTFFMPTAEKFVDEDGNELNGPDALEAQRAQMEAVEQAAQDTEASEEQKENEALLQEASRRAQENQTGVREEFDKLKAQKEEEAQLIKEIRQTHPPVKEDDEAEGEVEAETEKKE